MFDGRIEQEGPSHVFYERPASERIAAFFGNPNCIAGEKRGTRVTTEVGEFELTRTEAPDGPVTIMVRPEAIETPGTADAGQGRCNAVDVPVRRRVYTGTHTRYRVDLGGNEWEVLCDATSIRLDREERMRIVLPPEQIWAIPRPGGGSR
jgi:ABC-type Fe3+/spermidine/putrescine transport system ATPase subunit